MRIIQHMLPLRISSPATLNAPKSVQDPNVASKKFTNGEKTNKKEGRKGSRKSAKDIRTS